MDDGAKVGKGLKFCTNGFLKEDIEILAYPHPYCAWLCISNDPDNTTIRNWQELHDFIWEEQRKVARICESCQETYNPELLDKNGIEYQSDTCDKCVGI